MRCLAKGKKKPNNLQKSPDLFRGLLEFSAITAKKREIPAHGRESQNPFN
jgi:hypothetical protein